MSENEYAKQICIENCCKSDNYLHSLCIFLFIYEFRI